MIDGAAEFNHPELGFKKELDVLHTIEHEVRNALPDSSRDIDCILWTQRVEELLDDDLPKNLRIFHCTNNSTSDPHHWFEVEITDKSLGETTFIWDDTRQKMKEQSVIVKIKKPGIWSDYFESSNQKLQIVPSMEE